MTLPSFDGPQTRVSDSPRSSFDPEVVALTGGGFAVMWSGWADATLDLDQGQSPLVRLFSADRTPLGDPFPVQTDFAGGVNDPVLAATADGGFAVAWHEGAIGAVSDRIEVARFDAAGARVGAVTTLVQLSDPDDRALLVGLEGLAGGGLAAVFGETPVGGVRRTAAALLDADNALVSTVDLLPGVNIAGAAEDRVFAAGDGFGFLEDRFVPGAGREILFRSFGPDGAEALSTPLVAAGAGANALGATQLSDGRFAAVTLTYSGADTVFTTHILSAAGAVLASAAQPAEPTGTIFGEVVADGAGGFILLFQRTGPGTDDGAFAWLFDAAGARVPGEVRVARDLGGTAQRVDGAVLGDGDLVAAFEAAAGFGATPTIELQALDPSGTTAGATPTDIVLTGDPVTPGEAGAVVGTLSAVDADAGDAFTFEIVGFSPFEIDGTELRYAPGLAGDPGNAYLSAVTVRVTDSQFNSFDEVLNVEYEGVTPEPEPVIFRGSRRADREEGGAGDDRMSGKGGRDRLDGLGGDDRLDGGGGRDRLKGGGGADTLVGGKGGDLLIGGAGDDVFSFGRKDGRDRLRDWEDGADRLLFTAGAGAFEDLSIRRKGDDLLVSAGRTKVLIEDLKRADFDEGDVLFT